MKEDSFIDGMRLKERKDCLNKEHKNQDIATIKTA